MLLLPGDAGRHNEPPLPAPAVRAARLAIAATLTAAVLVSAAGAMAGRALREEPPPIRQGRVVEVGPIAFRTGPLWLRAQPPTGTRLDRAQTAAYAIDTASDAVALVSIDRAADPTLLPAGLRGLLTGAPPSPAPTTLAGAPAWRYADLPASGGRRLDVTLLPTTAGVLAVACVRAAGDPFAAPGCGLDRLPVDLRAARPVAPSPDLALRERLPGAMAALDRRRVPLRQALATAPTRRGQARFAHRIARAYARAGARLATVAPARSGATAAMHRADIGYRRLARAALRGRRGGFARARARVGAAERDLARALG